jgi:hypothetical protein
MKKARGLMGVSSRANGIKEISDIGNLRFYQGASKEAEALWPYYMPGSSTFDNTSCYSTDDLHYGTSLLSPL